MERLGRWSFRGYLPHYDAGSTLQVITFRLADSLPDYVTKKMLELAKDTADFRRQVEKYLDTGYGESLLLKPKHAETVKTAFQHFDGKRYRLNSWVVMPNHVHVLIEPLHGFPLGKIVSSWKGFTAYEIGRMESGYLKQWSRIWQPEYFDRYIRNAQHYEAVVRYIEDNPVKAGLVKAASHWIWSSAVGR